MIPILISRPIPPLPCPFPAGQLGTIGDFKRDVARPVAKSHSSDAPQADIEAGRRAKELMRQRISAFVLRR